MGHKYSTVYSHNTDVNYQQFLSRIIDNVDHVTDVLGSKCRLIESYQLFQSCKLCRQNMFHQQVLMLDCGKFKHRYHSECLITFMKVAHRENIFKCQGCRKILNLYDLETLTDDSHT